ncbi:MAG: hypothetical protein AAGA38_16985 [Pseudomonadota bacterium]
MRSIAKQALIGVALLTLASVPVFADVTASVVRQLGQQGYEIQSVQRTLLGRMRVISTQGDLRRETVFDPRSGAILRDVARRQGAAGLAGLLGPLGQGSDDADDRAGGSARSSESGSGFSGSDDRDEDDDSDDEDDDSDDDSDDDGDDSSDDGDDDSDDGDDDED